MGQAAAMTRASSVFLAVFILFNIRVTLGRTYTCLQHENTGYGEEIKKSRRSGTGNDDVATVTCDSGFDIVRCRCVGSCKGSTIFTDSTGSYCQAWNMAGGRGVKAVVTCRRLMITCETPMKYDEFPVISCPKNYKLVSCQIQYGQFKGYQDKVPRETREIPVAMHVPKRGDCSPKFECKDQLCRVSARCIRTRAFQNKEDRKIPCTDSGPKPKTCRGEEYEYKFLHLKECPVVFYKKKVSNLEQCRALCDSLCNCAGFTFLDMAGFPDCILHSIECIQNIDLALWGFVDIIKPQTGLYLKRRKGHPDESRILATSGVPKPTWKTCDGKVYDYFKSKRACLVRGMRREIHKSTLQECKNACDSDCQCRSIEFYSRKSVSKPRCNLLYFVCPASLLRKKLAELDTFIRYEKGSAPDFRGECADKEYIFYPIQYRDCKVSPRFAENEIRGLSLERCQEICAASCDCKSFNFEIYGPSPLHTECKLNYWECEEDELKLSYEHKVYYVKRDKEEPECPPKADSCKGEKYEFRNKNKVTCPDSYVIDRTNSSFPTRENDFCERACAENCQCEAALYHYFADYPEGYDNDSYYCTLMGRGCLKNLIYDDHFDGEDAKQSEPDFDSYTAPVYKRQFSKKMYIP